MAQSVRGTVVDSASGLPLAGAGVAVLNARGETVGHVVTDVSGSFTFRLSGFGEYRVRAVRIGFAGRVTEPITVDSLFAYTVQLALRPNPVPLDTLRVVAEKVTVEKLVPWLVENGFYNRRRWGFGYFLTRKEIERKIPVTMGDVLQGIPRTYGQMFVGKPCRRTVVVDGVPIHGGVGFVSPFDVEGVEVYNSPAGLPVQYSGYMSPCGAILIWTRR
jgi:hypothetical protein